MILAAAWCAIGAAVAHAEPGSLNERGAVIYRKLCAECHGDRGQGVNDKYEDPLHGSRSLARLTRRIERTMPEDKEDTVVGEDAEAVARYVYDAFYSKEARARQLKKIKPDMARLTVPQYRQTVADLIGAYRKNHNRNHADKRGLDIRYNGRHPEKKKNDKKIWIDHRDVVPQVHLDITDKLPYDDIDRSEKWGITWSGSIKAPETGEYEFVVKTPNGFRLWINEGSWRDEPTVDQSVVSGEGVREVTHRMFLIKGRTYPLMLKFSMPPDVERVFVDMLWKPPHGPLRRIPEHVLLPADSTRITVVSTKFPPDDASHGYERGTSVSAGWFDAVTRSAMGVATQVMDEINDLADTKPDDPKRPQRIRAFCEDFVFRALRRPLDDQTKKRLIDDHFDKAESPALAAKRVVLTTLCSPEFLYPEAGGDAQPPSYRIASRLALHLWDSLPDKPLLDDAKNGKLLDPQRVRYHARRMVDDPRTRAKLRGFFHHWLELERAENVAKDEAIYPGFDEHVLADLRTSLDMFLEHVVWSDKSDYRQLLTADYLYLNDRLRKLYGYEAPDEKAGDDFVRVTDPNDRRSGVITHPYLLTVFAYHNNTSPIHRGVFLTRNIIGRQLKPPPNAVEFKDSEFDPSLTMRQKVTRLTRDKACMACHETINPLGFSLEHFDGIGRWRNKDNDKPVNAVSDFADDDGKTIKLAGARDVAEFAVKSDSARRAFIQQLFHHFIKQDPHAYGLDTLDDLEKAFNKSDCHIRNLMADIAVTATMYGLDDALKTARVESAQD